MTNNINGIHKEIKASDQKLQTVTNTWEPSYWMQETKAEMLSIIVQCTAAMTRLKPPYACETWTLTI